MKLKHNILFLLLLLLVNTMVMGQTPPLRMSEITQDITCTIKCNTCILDGHIKFYKVFPFIDSLTKYDIKELYINGVFMEISPDYSKLKKLLYIQIGNGTNYVPLNIIKCKTLKEVVLMPSIQKYTQMYFLAQFFPIVRADIGNSHKYYLENIDSLFINTAFQGLITDNRCLDSTKIYPNGYRRIPSSFYHRKGPDAFMGYIKNNKRVGIWACDIAGYVFINYDLLKNKSKPMKLNDGSFELHFPTSELAVKGIVKNGLPDSNWVFQSIDGFKAETRMYKSNQPNSVFILNDYPSDIYRKWHSTKVELVDDTTLFSILNESLIEGKKYYKNELRSEWTCSQENDTNYCYLILFLKKGIVSEYDSRVEVIMKNFKIQKIEFYDSPYPYPYENYWHLYSLDKFKNPDKLYDPITFNYEQITKMGELKFNLDNRIFDKSGNGYITSKIGSQKWIMSNLRVGVLNNDSLIKIPTKYNSNWLDFTKNKTSGWVWGLENARGYFYNYFAIENNNICPMGWKVPSNTDWTVLNNYFNSTNQDKKNQKEIDSLKTAFYQSTSSGYINSEGKYINNNLSYFWSFGGHVFPFFNGKQTSFNNLNDDIKKLGFYVRCIKND